MGGGGADPFTLFFTVVEVADRLACIHLPRQKGIGHSFIPPFSCLKKGRVRKIFNPQKVKAVEIKPPFLQIVYTADANMQKYEEIRGS